MCICSDRKRKDRNSRKLRCIYSRQGITAEEYGGSAGAHRGIENSLHRVLDTAFHEDESRIRAENAAENMKHGHHIGINLLKQEKSCKMGTASKRKNAGMTWNIFLKYLPGQILE